MLWTGCNCGWWPLNLLRSFTDYRNYMGLSSIVWLCKWSLLSLISYNLGGSVTDFPLLKKDTTPFGLLLTAWPSQLISFPYILPTDHPTMLSCTSLRLLSCTECPVPLFLIEVLSSLHAFGSICIHSLVQSWFTVQPTILKPPVRLSGWIRS